MASPTHSDSSTSTAHTVPQSAPASMVQTINIRSHVPVLLDMVESNYTQWRCFFDSALGKFGLLNHVRSSPVLDQRDGDWVMIDHCVMNWLYNTMTTTVFNTVYKSNASAFTIWTDVEGLFRDNEMQRAIYLESEFCSIRQGDMSISQYCTKLKTLADALRDVGQPVSEPSQVLNLLRGLNPKYRHLKPLVADKFPPHTFLSARSYLMMAELQDEHDDK